MVMISARDAHWIVAGHPFAIRNARLAARSAMRFVVGHDCFATGPHGAIAKSRLAREIAFAVVTIWNRIR